MPRPSFKVYIDESGDEGFAFKGPRFGSSHWFVLSAVITRWEINHEKLVGLQIADAVASGFYFGVQATPLGFTEPRYAQMLKPVVYHHSGQHLGYGVKFWPGEADELLKSEPTLQWVKLCYQ